MEEWKDIEGYEGLYKVSNKGRVKSLEYLQLRYSAKGKPYYTRHKEIVLKPRLNNKGYFYVNLYKDKKMKTKMVHRLVATAFVQNPYNLEVVNHKDENPQNNNADNLEWCTIQYNCNYGTARERIRATKKENNAGCKQVYCIETGKIYRSMTDAALDVGVSTQHIFSAINHKCRCNTAGGFHWMYYEDYLEKGEVINPNIDRRKKIICIETGVIYPSLLEAERQTNISSQCIGKCCLGKRKTAGGYHWKYVTE